MKVTLTRQAVNHVNRKFNITPAGVFIDKLNDGQRSLKVWGWNALAYAAAVDFLLDRGCKVHVVKTHSFSARGGRFEGHLRLHVEES